MTSLSSQPYGKRAQQHHHPLARSLFEIVEAKKSNLTLSADLKDSKSLLQRADGKLFVKPCAEMGTKLSPVL